MSDKDIFYDVAIIGGGLAGLTLALQLSKEGRKVILFEKNRYPFHRVCGEYISMDSWPFIERIGVDLSKLNLPRLKKLLVSSPSGKSVSTLMKTGGFGISRFLFDDLLKQHAINSGATIVEGSTVEKVENHKYFSKLFLRSESVHASVVCGTFGKRSKLDLSLKRKLNASYNNATANYIGIKYHVEADLPKDVIELHNFKNGYCGISAIEDNKYCICYLTTAENLRLSNNSIEKMEHDILMKNPFLKKYLSSFPRMFSSPLSISQINFSSKLPVENNMLMIGDSAGMITPLCGNGMTMAMNASAIAAPLINNFLSGKISRNTMENNYETTWKKSFSSRLQTGRIIQRFFGSENLTEIFIATMKTSPILVSRIVDATHGKGY